MKWCHGQDRFVILTPHSQDISYGNGQKCPGAIVRQCVTPLWRNSVQSLMTARLIRWHCIVSTPLQYARHWTKMAGVVSSTTEKLLIFVLCTFQINYKLWIVNINVWLIIFASVFILCLISPMSSLLFNSIQLICNYVIFISHRIGIIHDNW